VNWQQWTDAAAGLRLALLLGLGAGLFILLPLVTERLPGNALLLPAAALGLYLLAVVIAGMLPQLKADAMRQTRLLGALMVGFVAILGWLLAQPAVLADGRLAAVGPALAGSGCCWAVSRIAFARPPVFAHCDDLLSVPLSAYPDT